MAILVKAYDALGMADLRDVGRPRAADQLPEQRLPQGRRRARSTCRGGACGTPIGSRVVSRRILVIGAAGMIGRKLVERLAKDAGADLVLHDVVALRKQAQDGRFRSLARPAKRKSWLPRVRS